MVMPKFPINFPTRLKQFFCKHETISRSAFTKGINSKKGYFYVLYECGKCRHCITRWEKEEEFYKDFPKD